MEHTKGELKFIHSTKHPGDVFIKIKHTKDTFLCKFYGGNGVEAKEQALINTTHFVKCWNSHDDLLAFANHIRKEEEYRRKLVGTISSTPLPKSTYEIKAEEAIAKAKGD